MPPTEIVFSNVVIVYKELGLEKFADYLQSTRTMHRSKSIAANTLNMKQLRYVDFLTPNIFSVNYSPMGLEDEL